VSASTTQRTGEPIAGCIAGDADAWRIVFDRHAAVVRAYARARVGPDGADDIVVEAFATAWEQRERIRADVTTLRPWLLGIVVKLVQRRRADERRWLEGIRRAGGIEPIEPSGSDPADASTFDGPSMRALASLPPSERELLLLVALGELKVHEAAGVLGISAVAARVRISRARARATKYLTRYEHQEVTT
jgi:RNA polymerase sigma-70 factor (ECF subfamily)